jgi:hypothetical protein
MEWVGAKGEVWIFGKEDGAGADGSVHWIKGENPIFV